MKELQTARNRLDALSEEIAHLETLSAAIRSNKSLYNPLYECLYGRENYNTYIVDLSIKLECAVDTQLTKSKRSLDSARKNIANLESNKEKLTFKNYQLAKIAFKTGTEDFNGYQIDVAVMRKQLEFDVIILNLKITDAEEWVKPELLSSRKQLEHLRSIRDQTF